MNPSVLHSHLILHRKGTKPNPAHAVPFDAAAPLFLKGVESDPEVRMFDAETQMTYMATDADLVRAAYLAQLPPGSLAVRSQDGALVTQVSDISAALDDMARHKQGGLYIPKDNLWMIQPPENNPNYEQQIANLSEAVADLNEIQPPTAQRNHQEVALGTYPIDVGQDADVEFLPGLSGDKVLEATTGFIRNSSPATLAVFGSLAGLVAYKSMGLKGVAGLVLAVLALKRYLRMGHKAIVDQRLDLVARGIRDGIPVNKDGAIDADFMDALRLFPAGDNKITTRRIDPAIQARPWESNAVKVDPDSWAMESLHETASQSLDGDTFSGLRGRYRLIGIDVPATVAREGTHAPTGAPMAWARLRDLIPPGKPVRVEVATNQPALYGRLPCYLYTKNECGEEICVNKLLVEEGLARVTNFQPLHPKIREFAEAALSAIANRKGLWNAVHDPNSQLKPIADPSDRNHDRGGLRSPGHSLS